VAILPETNKKRKGELEIFIHFWSAVKNGKRANTGVSIAIKKKSKKYTAN
jgi:hypothetical protein